MIAERLGVRARLIYLPLFPEWLGNEAVQFPSHEAGSNGVKNVIIAFPGPCILDLVLDFTSSHIITRSAI